jgi:hypothetical protein
VHVDDVLHLFMLVRLQDRELLHQGAVLEVGPAVDEGSGKEGAVLGSTGANGPLHAKDDLNVVLNVGGAWSDAGLQLEPLQTCEYAYKTMNLQPSTAMPTHQPNRATANLNQPT